MSVLRQVSTSKSPSISAEVTQNYWAQKPDQLFQELQSSLQGLSQPVAEQLLEKYGPNVLKARREPSPLMLFLNQFKSPIVLILIFATLLSAFLQDWHSLLHLCRAGQTVVLPSLQRIIIIDLP